MRIYKRFPTEYQMDSQDCGPASLKMVAKHFGRYYSLQYLRDRCGITKEGVSLLDLSTGAEAIGRKLHCRAALFDVRKVRRGHYECTLVPLSDDIANEPRVFCNITCLNYCTFFWVFTPR